MDSLPPGCLLVLVQLSTSMADEVPTPTGMLPGWASAQTGVDQLLDWLVLVAQDGGLPLDLSLGVFGYRATEAAVTLDPLLPQAGTRSWVPLSELLVTPVADRGEGLPRQWTQFPEPMGEPAPTAALGFAHRLLVRWLGIHPTSHPPLVVHWTDGAETGSRYATGVRSLSALSSTQGPVRLIQVGVSAHVEQVLPVQTSLGDLPEPWAELATLAPTTVNDFATMAIWDRLFSEPEPIEVVEPEGPALVPGPRFWSQKLGNEPHYWEDAEAIRDDGLVAAIADGASEGIFSRQWARLLVDRFLTERPNLSQPGTLPPWLTSCRATFHRVIAYDALRWSQQKKVDEVGAAATLLTLELGRPTPEGRRPWRAVAIGDACLFWLSVSGRSGSFPVLDAAQLGSTPDLLRTKPGTRVPPVLVARGSCRPGDLFLLATDAVAGDLLRTPNPESWRRYLRLDPTDWLTEVDAKRRSGHIVNDDCTLIVLPVGLALGTDPQPMVPLELDGDKSPEAQP